MQTFRQSDLLAGPPSRHLTSGPHLRVQVRRLRSCDDPPEPFPARHGEVMVLCVEGRVRIEATSGLADLDTGDQALIPDGQSFRLIAALSDAIVQLTWAPGPNPCKECWELNSRFFDE